MTLLESRLKEFGIQPCPYQPAFDRVVVYKLPDDMSARDTYSKSGVIVKPDNVRARDKDVTPRGVLIGAGIGAMDYLRSNAIELGHIVWIVRLSPWQHVVEVDENGREVGMAFLHAADIVGSEDLLQAIKSKKVRIKVGDDGKHQYSVSDSAMPRFDPPEFIDT
jgi:hypothetical protein